MERLNIPEDIYSPGIDFNPETGVFKMWGKSLPENPERLFRPILDWTERFAEHPTCDLNMEIDLMYLNTASTKWLRQILTSLKSVIDKGKSFKVEWVYEEYDEDMEDLGKDMASLTKLDFTYREKPEED